ncbi:hypothetical protein [Fischerella sp. PCC 9605]|uniref:hypothetical protein n=1 Tax=Fischerella sp. PCC 9605 TaxID=1173024 RepID=UPI0012DF42C7|nr:hypothetical protein [Fischerella sp. PCC 9605]
MRLATSQADQRTRLRSQESVVQPTQDLTQQFLHLWKPQDLLGTLREATLTGVYMGGCGVPTKRGETPFGARWLTTNNQPHNRLTSHS